MPSAEPHPSKRKSNIDWEQREAQDSGDQFLFTLDEYFESLRGGGGLERHL